MPKFNRCDIIHMPTTEYRRGHGTRLPFGDDLMLVTLPDSDIHWMEPRDLSLQEIHIQCDDAGQPIGSTPRITDSIVIKEKEGFELLDEEETLQRIRAMQEVSRDREVQIILPPVTTKNPGLKPASTTQESPIQLSPPNHQ